jgi:hypothetical protein
MTHPFTPVTFLAFLSLPAVGAAQNLIALTRNLRTIHQGSHATCTPLGTCSTSLPLQNVLSYWPGGTAWDGTTNALWCTTGQILERHPVAPCGQNCLVNPCPKSSLTAEVMGMDINELANELWILDDAGIVTRCTNVCPPVVQGSFPVPGIGLVGNTAPTAIAIDEMNGIVFYTTSDFGGGGSWIHCAQLANPGSIFQTAPMQICFATLITGMAVHPGLGKLYVTNGRETFDWNYTYSPGPPVPSVTFAGGACCVALAPPGDPFIDLSIRWAPATPLGEPCANGNCPVCPMVHVLRNAPLLGTNLQLGLDLAPPAIPVWCILSFGTCQPTGPSPAPLCGPLRVPVGGAPLAALGFVVTSGTACNASATIILPLPGNPAFLGTPLASQFVGICAPAGTTMSNCLSWVLQ